MTSHNRFVSVGLALALFITGAIALHAQVLDSMVVLPQSEVLAIDFTRDGRTVVTRDRDSIRFWDARSGVQVGVTLPTHVGDSNSGACASFMPGDSTILYDRYGVDSALSIVNWRTGAVKRRIEIHRKIYEAALTMGGTEALIRVPERQLYELWNLEDGSLDRALSIFNDTITNVDPDTTGQYAIGRKMLEGRYLRLGLFRGGHIDTFPVNERSPLSVRRSRDGSLLGISRIEEPPIIFDVRTLKTPFELQFEYNRDTIGLMAMDFSPDSRWIITITRRYNQTPALDLWDGTNGRHIREMTRDTMLRASALYVSPSGDYIIVRQAYVGIVLLPIQLPTGDVPGQHNSGSVAAAVVPNPTDGESILTYTQPIAGDASIRVVAVDGRTLRLMQLPRSNAGEHHAPIATDGMAPGLYFCIVEIPGGRSSIPFTVMR